MAGYVGGVREAPVLLLPCAVGLALLYGSHRSWRRHDADRARLCLGLALVAICITQSARRMLPPHSDLSALTRRAVPAGPQERVPVVLAGVVSDFPDRGDFRLTFPLECAAVRSGRVSYPQMPGTVWVDAPLDTQVEVGDAVTLHTDLADLPRAGNLGEAPPHDTYIAAGCWCLAHLERKSQLTVTQTGARYPLLRWIAGLRRRLLAHYDIAFGGTHPPLPARPYPHATAQLLAAMIFGQGGLQEPLPFQTRSQFRAAGLSHLLVASGQQVAFLTLFLIGAARVIGLRRWWLLALVLPVLILYALITGGGPSIGRATIAGLCVAWALLVGRDVDGLSLWSLALSLILLADPIQLFSISLQLTFAATWGLLVLSPVIGDLLARMTATRDAEDDEQTAGDSDPTTDRGRHAHLNQLVSFSLGAQLATLPLLLYHFGRFSASGLGANFAAVPLAGLLVGTGIVGLALGPVNLLNYPLTRGIGGIATAAATAPGAQTTTPPISLQWVLLLYAVLLLSATRTGLGAYLDRRIVRDEFGRWWRRQRRWLAAVHWPSVLLALVLAVTVWMVWRMADAHSHWLRVALLDVGQGESIVVQSPTGRTVIIDGGTSEDEGRGEVGRAVIVPYLASLGVNRLDAMIITHADADHCNALPTVIAEVPVGMAIDGTLGASPSAAAARKGGAHGSAADAAAHARVALALWSHHIPVLAARPGQRLDLGDGITMTVLSPTQPPMQSSNNNGAAVRLDYGGTSMLFTADLEHDAEERLVRRGTDLHCTVLKLGHHGSKSSTSPLLLDAARPQMAMLSCGRYNKFGHPAAETLARLAQRHIPVFRTDRDGAIEVFSDGRACWVQTFR